MVFTAHKYPFGKWFNPLWTRNAIAIISGGPAVHLLKGGSPGVEVVAFFRSWVFASANVSAGSSRQVNPKKLAKVTNFGFIYARNLSDSCVSAHPSCKPFGLLVPPRMNSPVASVSSPSTSPIRSSSSFQQILTAFSAEPLGPLHWLRLCSNTGAGVSVLLVFPESRAFSLVLGSLLSNSEIVKTIV